MNNNQRTIVFAFFLIAASGINAEEKTAFCASDSGFDQWDFWVGEWTVTSMKGGVYLGRNSIKKMADGCLLLEEWDGIQEAYGISMNYYNPHTRVWRQIWVDNAGYSIDYHGGLEGKSMLLEGKFYSHADGKVIGFRGTWTPLENGSVRQVFEIQNDTDKTWSVNWDARYERVKIDED